MFRFPLRRWTWLGCEVQGGGGAWKLQRKAGHRWHKVKERDEKSEALKVATSPLKR